MNSIDLLVDRQMADNTVKTWTYEERQLGIIHVRDHTLELTTRSLLIRKKELIPSIVLSTIRSAGVGYILGAGLSGEWWVGLLLALGFTIMSTVSRWRSLMASFWVLNLEDITGIGQTNLVLNLDLFQSLRIFIGGVLMGRIIFPDSSNELLIMNGIIALFVAKSVYTLAIGRRPVLIPLISGFNASSSGSNFGTPQLNNMMIYVNEADIDSARLAIMSHVKTTKVVSC